MKQLLKKEGLCEWGVSPVVGVILMVAITVGLAAVVGVTVFGLGDQVSNNTSTVGLDSSQVESEYTITAQSGQFDSFEYVYVTSTSSGVTYSGGISGAKYPTGPNNSSQYLYSSGSGGVGTNVNVNISDASESGEIIIIGVSNENEQVLRSYEFNGGSESSVRSTIDTSSTPKNLQEKLANMTGNGTEANPYEISNVYELQAMSENISASYVLVGDIDASDTQLWNNGSGFEPIGPVAGNGENGFVGNLDGNGYEIQELTIERPNENNVGLFRAINMGSVVRNVSLSTVDVTGYDTVGGIVGHHIDGTIMETDISGTVTAHDFVGGIIGQTQSSGNLQASSSSVDVVGNNYVGGIVGLNSENIGKSYSTGTVEGEIYVGGIVGWNNGDGILTETYATGNIDGQRDSGGITGNNLGTVQDSYWDTQTTGQGTSSGGIGLTTSEMTGPDSLLNMSGFTESVWMPTSEYPELN